VTLVSSSAYAYAALLPFKHPLSLGAVTFTSPAESFDSLSSCLISSLSSYGSTGFLRISLADPNIAAYNLDSKSASDG